VPIWGTDVVDVVNEVVDAVSVVDAVVVVDAVSVVDAVAVVYVELDPKALSVDDDDGSAVPGKTLLVPLLSCRTCKCLWSKRNSSC
jgi:hypothetical protein